MAGSTYSSNLKIELMTTGENSGTWGDITNTNLGTALEQAVIGLGNPDYLSDANLTITITNSNASQAARALVLNVTSSFGSLTGTRELVVPTIQKQYIVQNNTTGGQSITVKTSAGTGILVPNGRKAHLYVDGTDVIQMFDYVDVNGGSVDGTSVGASSASTGAFTTLTASGAATLNGTVALGNASADLITVPGTLNSSLLFTDAAYDIGATGANRPRNLFLSGAATVGGNLSVGGTLTLTGGVNLNGNVTVGDSALDTLTINSTVTSNLIFTDNTYDIGATGATRPRNLFLAGNATVGGAQTLTGALTVDSTTDSSSTTTGSIQTDGGLGVAKALFVGTTANVAGAVTLSGGTANGVTYLDGSKVLTSGTALAFDGANLGIGIAAPVARLSVFASTAVDAVRITQTGAGNAFVVEDSTNPDASPFVIDAAGVVLAGFTTAPAGSYKAYVSGTAFATGAWRVGDSTDGSTSGYISNTSNTTKSIQIAADPDNVGASSIIALNIDGSEKARFDSSGRFFLGTASSSTAGIKNAWNLTGGTTAYGDLVNGTIQSDVTGNASLVATIANTAAATFNITNLRHYYATANPFGAGSTVTNQYGFFAASDLSEATNNYGFYSTIASGTGEWNFYAAGTASNYFAGSVGIGTTAPLAALNVNGTGGELLRISVTSDSGTIQEPALGFAMGVTNVYPATQISALEFDASDARASMLFYTRGINTDSAPTERMRIDSAGNVGIGTASPTYQTQIYGSGQTTAALTDAGNKGGSLLLNTPTVSAGDGGALLFGAGGSGAKPFAAVKGLLADGGGNTTGAIAFSTRSATGDTALSERMRLDASGNLGIGTTSPSAKLDIAGTLRIDTTSNIYGKADNTSFVSLYGGGAYNAGAGIGLGGTSQAVNPNIIVFTRGSYVETARFDAAGNLGLGVTPSAWLGAGYQQFPGNGFIGNAISYSGNSITTGVNAYYSDAWRYKASSLPASYYSQGAGTHTFFTAPSGTAGNAITFTQAMTLDASGNLGVGTTSPTARLEVAEYSASESGNSGAIIVKSLHGVAEDNSISKLIFAGLNRPDGFAKISASGSDFNSGNGNMRFYTAISGTLTERARIDYAGNLGVGTTSPGYKLDVVSSQDGATRARVNNQSSGASASSGLLLDAYGGGWTIDVPASTTFANPLKFTFNTTERMRLDSAGNLGLGVTPSAWAGSGPGQKVLQLQSFAISSDVNTSYHTNNATFTSGSNWFYNASKFALKVEYDSAVGAFRWYNAPSGTAGNFIPFTQAMTLDASGNLLVGTTTNPQTTKLALQYGGTNVWGVGPNSGSATFYVVNSAGTGVYLSTGATSWSATSDERLKTTLVPFENAAAKVCTLRAGTGRYLTDEDTVSRSFLIAQDVQKVLPEAISVEDNEQKTLGLRYQELIPLLTAAIQEQQALITALTDRITALEAK